MSTQNTRVLERVECRYSLSRLGVRGWPLVISSTHMFQLIFLASNSFFSVVHLVGHEGITKTLHRIQASFYIPEKRRLLQEFIRTYVTCQKYKSQQLYSAGLLQPLPTNHSSCTRRDCFSLYRYLIAFGSILAWTSSRDCPKLHTK